MNAVQSIDTLVIGGGQAGLSVSYHLRKRGVEHLVLDAAPRIGDAWRNRWDSLRLFTPARYDGLDGRPFPGNKGAWPTKDAMADYLADYAAHFDLPVRSGRRVDELRLVEPHDDDDGFGFEARSGDETFRARHVVIAMSDYQTPRLPAFATDLSRSIRQLHAQDYRNPAQLAPGTVLLVGAGNSGAEIASELAATHPVVVSGPNTRDIPGSFSSPLSRHLIVHILNGFVFNHVLSVNTPIGRRARRTATHAGVPLIRVKSRDLLRLGVRRAGRVTGVQNGLPVVDGAPLEVANVIWCTGYAPGFDWIRIPVLDDSGEPEHERGIVAAVPGLYFVGLHFLTSLSSAMVHGVGTDAARIANRIAEEYVPVTTEGRAVRVSR
ncbi:putative flavoprotein involved in K+ transport [Leifsonia sp. EB41]|uniref:flavin-containing monooxygenase n=1 Tax=Leifsonia sp. EB41 TaxID=3156260 RepID=UPI00351640C1